MTLATNDHPYEDAPALGGPPTPFDMLARRPTSHQAWSEFRSQKGQAHRFGTSVIGPQGAEARDMYEKIREFVSLLVEAQLRADRLATQVRCVEGLERGR